VARRARTLPAAQAGARHHHRVARVRLQRVGGPGAGNVIVIKGFILLLAGVPVYVGMRWWQKRSALTVPVEDAS